MERVASSCGKYPARGRRLLLRGSQIESAHADRRGQSPSPVAGRVRRGSDRGDRSGALSMIGRESAGPATSSSPSRAAVASPQICAAASFSASARDTSMSTASESFSNPERSDLNRPGESGDADAQVASSVQPPSPAVGDDGLAKDPLHQPSHPKVGHKRQRRHQLGESHLRRGMRSHQPILRL